MSDARERLIEAAPALILDGVRVAALSLDAFLAHPDDLIACLVESIGSDVLIERVEAMEREADIQAGRLIVPSRTEGGEPR